MEARGRKPKPTVVKLNMGNPGKRALNKQEAQPVKGRPACPAHMCKEAKSAWKKLIPLLENAHLVTKIDGFALETLCETYAKWIDAHEKLYKTGLIVVTASGFPVQNPLIGIVNNLFKQLNVMFAQFGLTPAERSRIQVPSGGNDGDDYSTFRK